MCVPEEENEITASFKDASLKVKYSLYRRFGTSPVFKNVRNKKFVLACMQQAFPDIMDFMDSEYGKSLTMGPIPSILATKANLNIIERIKVTQSDLEKLFDDAPGEEVLFVCDTKFSAAKAIPSPKTATAAQIFALAPAPAPVPAPAPE